MEQASGDHRKYRITFADEASAPIAFTLRSGQASEPRNLAVIEVTTSPIYPHDLSAAEVTAIASTTVSVDAGAAPGAGEGIEVRRSDAGWGFSNDRNLAGRFATRTFTLPRLSRVQDYYLRSYDAAGRYSQYSTLLHVDYPL